MIFMGEDRWLYQSGRHVSKFCYCSQQTGYLTIGIPNVLLPIASIQPNTSRFNP